MDLQERFDELDNIVRTLDNLINDIKDKEYIDMLSEIKFEVEDELQEVENKLSEEEKEYQYGLEVDWNNERI